MDSRNSETFPARPAPTRVPSDSNPWAAAESDTDPASSQPPDEVSEQLVLPPLPPPSLEETLLAAPPPDLDSAAIDPPAIDTAALNEFDPLANKEERAARDAWQSAESHPPPPRTPSPPVDFSHENGPTPPQKDLASGPPSRPASSSFPSFAALARTFQLPLPRSRPQAIDTAQPITSPALLSAVAHEQQRSEHPEQTTSDGGLVTEGQAPSDANDVPQSSTKDKDTNSFDFLKFLDQMKQKSAEPIAKYLRSFLSNFAKRTFTMGDQVKIIHNFLNSIASHMREIDIWKNASDVEFDNAMEGMEKLVMNRLYEFTFTPQVARANPPRPITADDLERDRVLAQRIALFGWIEESHLDIPEGEGSKGFLMFAQQRAILSPLAEVPTEQIQVLMKINHYKAPRDKLICILNCCKVIFGLIRHLKREEGADSFVPILIYVVLKANPEHLLSNVEFINRFRNPSKLQSEAGYYLSSLMGAVSFVETMDHTSLSNITQQEFERNVEEAIQRLPEEQPLSPPVSRSGPTTPKRASTLLPTSPHAGEESAQPLSLTTPQSISNDAKRLLQRTGDTISRPLSAIGRIFSDALDNVGSESKLPTFLPGPFAPLEIGRELRAEGAANNASPNTHWAHPDQIRQYSQPQTPMGDGGFGPPIQTPYKPRVRRSQASTYFPQGSPNYGGVEETPTRHSASTGPHTNQPLALGPSQQLGPPLPRLSALNPEGGGGDPHPVSRTPTPALDLAAVQEQIDEAAARAGQASRETLRQIFPGTDEEVVSWVLEANEGDLGKSIEQLLEMSSGS